MHARRFRTEVRRLGYLVMTFFFVLLELSPHVEDSSAVYCELCRIKHCYISLLCSHIISTLLRELRALAKSSIFRTGSVVFHSGSAVSHSGPDAEKWPAVKAVLTNQIASFSWIKNKRQLITNVSW